MCFLDAKQAFDHVWHDCLFFFFFFLFFFFVFLDGVGGGGGSNYTNWALTYIFGRLL